MNKRLIQPIDSVPVVTAMRPSVGLTKVKMKNGIRIDQWRSVVLRVDVALGRERGDGGLDIMREGTVKKVLTVCLGN